MKELFKELTLASGAGGDETEVRRIVRRELDGVVDEMHADRMGNLIANLRGTSDDAPVLMFTAHLDEIGLIVSRVEEFGGVRFEKLGWIDDRMLISRVVHINTRKGKLTGLIGIPAFSHLSEQDRKGPTPFKKLFVDLGTTTRAETEQMGVRVGDRITFRGDVVELANGIIVTKACDDRVGLYALLETMKRLKETKHEAKVVAAFVAQHEIGLRGSKTAAYAVHPDVSIHLDVTGRFLDDPPAGAIMGGGPVIRLMEDYGTNIGFGAQKGILVHRAVSDLLVQCAEKEGLPCQLQIKPGVIGDQVEIHTSREGVLSGYILIPSGYLHSQHEIVGWDGIEQAITLALSFSTAVTRDFVDGAVDLDRLA
jgi:putative aminopeptidase FrvX